MRIAYEYKLHPTKEQAEKIEKTFDMLRYQYNYMLAEKFDWWEQNRCWINACPLICHLPQLKDQPTRFSQQKSLTQLKVDIPSTFREKKLPKRQQQLIVKAPLKQNKIYK